MERNGTIAVIIGIIIILVGTEIAVRYLEPPAPDLSKFYAFQDSLEADKNFKKGGGLKNAQDTIKFFMFNPNTISDSGFTALGFSEREIRTIRNYKDKAGDFKTKSQFRLMHFFDDDRFSSLEIFIDLPNETEEKSKSTHFTSSATRVKWSDTADVSIYKYNPIIADLNKSDTTELKKLPGIGSYYAQMIVQTRKDLGGYHSIAQLLELRNMTTETIDKFADKVTIDKTHIIKLQVNRATAQELAEHKYISFDLASRIVESREASGIYRRMQDIVERGLCNAELSLKLAPYIEFD